MPSEHLKDFWGNHINIQIDEKDIDGMDYICGVKRC